MTDQKTEYQYIGNELDGSKEPEQVNTGDGSVEKKEGTDQEPKPAQDKEKQRLKSAIGQIKSEQEKIDRGEKTKEECPVWMQNDLRDKPVEPNEEDIKAKLKAEIKDDIVFEQLQESLPDDLSQEQADELNKVLQDEITKGRTKAEALEYAMFKTNISPKAQVSATEKMIEATSMPIIKPKTFTPKKESLVKTEGDKLFMQALKDQYDVEIEV